MKIDKISSQLLGFAFYVDKQKPGTVSENWLDEQILRQVKDFEVDDIKKFEDEFHTNLSKVEDENRKIFLEQLFDSLTFQLSSDDSDLDTFYKKTFFIEIEEVTDDFVKSLEDEIKQLSYHLGKEYPEIQKGCLVKKNEMITLFEGYLGEAKKKLPAWIKMPENNLEYELVSDVSWSAFNQHTKPFSSKILINSDLPVTTYDLKNLVQHESWAGHHTELCLKDRLLVEEGRGEHGIVITYSPQTYLSEALAVAMFDIWGFEDWLSEDEQLLFLVDKLIFALQNKTTFLLHKHQKSEDEVRNVLAKSLLTDTQREYILGFSLDNTYGKYAAVYHSSGEYLRSSYQIAQNKDGLLQSLFTQPMTVERVEKMVLAST